MTAITGPIELPGKPALKTDSPTMLDWGGTLTPPNGGPVQRIMRLGTRFSLDFTLPTMRTEPLGRQWAALLCLAQLYGAILPWGQDGLVVGPCGAPVVDGGGQSGSSIALRGFTPGYEVRIGQAVPIIHAGRYYMHFAAARGVALDGKLVLPIYPMLRIIPDDGDVAAVAKPMIQGSLSGQQRKWQRLTAPWTDLGTITITEDE